VKALVLLVTATACTLVAGVVPGASAPTPYRYDPVLATLARETLWHAGRKSSRLTRSEVRSVGVRCYRTAHSFESTFVHRFGRSPRQVVAYYAGGRDVNLRPDVCVNTRAFFRGEVTTRNAGAYAVLLHEALHRQGVRNERVTTCFADEAVHWGMRWYGFSEAEALRGRNLAFDYTRLYAPPRYRMGKPNCLLLAQHKGWPSFAD